jgi:hypothetical protein
MSIEQSIKEHAGTIEKDLCGIAPVFRIRLPGIASNAWLTVRQDTGKRNSEIPGCLKIITGCEVVKLIRVS